MRARHLIGQSFLNHNRRASDDWRGPHCAEGMAMIGDMLNNRLLLIDDDPGLRRVVKKMAEGMGFEVVDTEDPRFFIKTVRGWRPSVVILDLMMPGADGIEL